MSIFAVDYTYVDDSALLDQHRPAHRAFLAELVERGNVVASGPIVGEPKALILTRADSASAALSILDADPFLEVGAIAERQVREWNVIFGADALTK